MKTRHAVLGIIWLLIGVAWAQNRVISNQGKPGNEGAWPVSVVGVQPVIPAAIAGPDGGAVIVQGSTYPSQCAQVARDGGVLHKNTVVGTSAVPVPAVQTALRAYIEICNSLQNAGTPILKCRVDGTAPVMAVTNAGDTLGVGDCRVYPNASSVAPQCISDASGTNALSYECVPIGL